MSAPIDMLLFCPRCDLQHVDALQPEKDWTNPPHRSHECQGCGHVWRPADVPTNGVRAIQTKGARDGYVNPGSDWVDETVAALRAECARLREEVARLTTNLEYLSKYHSGCGAHSMTIVKRAERAEASLAEALDVARLVVSGGDKDGFWSSDWGHVYGRARALLSRLRPSTPSAGGGG